MGKSRGTTTKLSPRRLPGSNLGAHQYPEFLAEAPSFHRVRQTKSLM